MDFRKFLSSFAPLTAVAMAALVAGCDHANVTIDGEKGKLLSELDLSGAPPHGVVLFGPDKVEIARGDKLAITVDGDPAEAAHLRYTLKDGTLGILREKGAWTNSKPVTVKVSMPAPSEVTMTGSGSIHASELAPKAQVVIAGSGDVVTGALAAEKLDVNIAGSGNFRAEGKAATLNLTIAGSGSANLAGLRTDTADISIVGSGDARFASDGKVKANVAGSGSVYVKGRAQCEISAVGSGKLVCEP